MAAIKPIGLIAEKWSRVTPQRTPDYEAGVRSPRAPWADSAKAAEPVYEAGVQAAIGRKAFGKGVTAAGNEKWQAKALAKGTQRYGPGVQVSGPDYERGFGPFAETIARTTLPPRVAKGDPRNIERVRVMAAALAAQKRR